MATLQLFMGLCERHFATRLPERESKTGEAKQHHAPGRGLRNCRGDLRIGLKFRQDQ